MKEDTGNREALEREEGRGREKRDLQGKRKEKEATLENRKESTKTEKIKRSDEGEKNMMISTIMHLQSDIYPHQMMMVILLYFCTPYNDDT